MIDTIIDLAKRTDTIIELAKLYATDAVLTPPPEIISKIDYTIYDPSVVPYDKKSDVAFSILYAALQRTGECSITTNPETNGSCVVLHLRNPTAQVIEKIRNIQTELGKGWQKTDNGHYQNVRAFKNGAYLDPHLFKNVLGDDVKLLRDGVLLTTEQVNKAADIIGFTSPARQR